MTSMQLKFTRVQGMSFSAECRSVVFTSIGLFWKIAFCTSQFICGGTLSTSGSEFEFELFRIWVTSPSFRMNTEPFFCFYPSLLVQEYTSCEVVHRVNSRCFAGIWKPSIEWWETSPTCCNPSNLSL